MRMTPSTMLSPKDDMDGISRSESLPSSVGSSTNSPTASRMPSTTATPMMIDFAFSSEKCASIH